MDYYTILIVVGIVILVPVAILAYYISFKIVISDWKEYKGQEYFDSKIHHKAYKQGFKNGYEACKKDLK